MVHKFVAKRLVNLLIQHGNLEAQIRDIRLRQDEELAALEAAEGLTCHEARICRRNSGTSSSATVSSQSSPASAAAFGASDKKDTIMVLRGDLRTEGHRGDHYGWEDTNSHFDGVKFLELPFAPQPRPLAVLLDRASWKTDGGDDDWEGDLRVGNAFGRVESIHSALIFVASAVIVRHLRLKKRAADKNGSKRWQVTSSCTGRRRVDTASLLLARTSLCLMAALLVVHYAPFSRLTPFAHVSTAATRLLHGKLKHVAWNRIFFRSSLWALLISIAPDSLSKVWGVLIPDASTLSFILHFNTPSKSKWSTFLHIGEIAAILVSIGMVYWLAYLDLPLFRSFLNGSLLSQLGFSHGTIMFLHQIFSSFIAYCLFAKISPSTTSTNTADQPSSPPKKTRGKFGNANPAVVQRMAALAQEALARVEQRKKIMAQEGGSAATRMTRSYSVATFNPDKYHEEETIVSVKNRSRGMNRSCSSGIDRSPILCPSSVGGGPRKTLGSRRMSENNYNYYTPTSSPLIPRKVSEQNGVSSSNLLVPTPPFPSNNNMNNIPTPIRRKLRPSLTSLPEQPRQNITKNKNKDSECDTNTKQSSGTTITYKPNPLLDIHLAGPSHSSKDVFANLEKNKSIQKQKKTHESTVPRSLYIPYPAEEGKYAEETASSTGGGEYEEQDEEIALLKLDEGYDRALAIPLVVGNPSSSSLSPSSPVQSKEMELAFLKSNPQSASTTPVPEHEYLP